MFKCLNDCVKNPDHRSGLLCRPQGRPVTLKKAAFRRKFVFSLENQSRFNLGTIRSNPFGKSSSFKGRGIPGFNPKPITFLDFGIWHSFDIWALAFELKTQNFLLTALFWGKARSRPLEVDYLLVLIFVQPTWRVGIGEKWYNRIRPLSGSHLMKTRFRVRKVFFFLDRQGRLWFSLLG